MILMLMLLLCFVLTYALFDSLTVDAVPIAATAAAYLGLFTLATVCICRRQRRFSLKALLPGLACLCVCASFVLHSDETLHVALFLLLIPLSGLYCLALTGANVHSFGSFYILLDLVRCELLLPLRHLFAPIAAGVEQSKKRRTAKQTARKSRAWLPVVLGLLMASPVLLVVIPLLIDADAAFESFAGAAFAAVQKALEGFADFISTYFELNGFALFLALLFTPYICAVIYNFAAGKVREENNDTSGKYLRWRRAPAAFFVSFLGALSAVYAVYLLSQSAYFFSAFSGRLPFGAQFTVTEYARRGFFELAKLAAINLALLGCSVGFCRRRESRLPGAIKGLNAFLCVFTMLLCAISMSKILLYIRTYGLTEKRVYVFAADVILFFVFVSILLRLFIERFPYMKVILGVGCTCAVLLGLLGVNNTVARYNTAMLLAGALDERSVADLWYDCDESGLPYLEQIAESDSDYAEQAQKTLQNIYYDHCERREEPFYNLEQARFVRSIKEHGVSEDSLILQTSFDLDEDVYALEYACLLKGKTVFGGGLAHADASPLDAQEYLEIPKKDLPENVGLENLELRFSLRFSPEEDAPSVAVKEESSERLQGAAFGETVRVFFTREDDGELVVW